MTHAYRVIETYHGTPWYYGASSKVLLYDRVREDRYGAMRIGAV